MGLIRRAVVAYYRANVAAWESLKRLLPSDPWVVLGIAQFVGTAMLVVTGRSGAALIVAAAGLVMLAVQRAIDA